MPARSPFRRVRLAAALFCASSAVMAPAQDLGSAPLSIHPANPDDPVEQLGRYLRVLSSSPRDLEALTGAGTAALKVGDANAALGFFARAEEVAPRNGRIKAGLGAALTQMEKPREALKLFDQAADLGYPAAEFASDRGLAHDLRGENRRAQADYQLALRTRPDDETVRRLALSLAISGDRAQALQLLDPLLRKQDKAAWRAQAFVHALTGDTSGAARQTELLMPRPQAQAMTPFFARLGTLKGGDKAAAVHFGRLPANGRTYSQQELAQVDQPIPATPGLDRALVPSGASLGGPTPGFSDAFAAAARDDAGKASRRRPGREALTLRTTPSGSGRAGGAATAPREQLALAKTPSGAGPARSSPTSAALQLSKPAEGSAQQPPVAAPPAAAAPRTETAQAAPAPQASGATAVVSGPPRTLADPATSAPAQAPLRLARVETPIGSAELPASVAPQDAASAPAPTPTVEPATAPVKRAAAPAQAASARPGPKLELASRADQTTSAPSGTRVAQKEPSSATPEPDGKAKVPVSAKPEVAKTSAKTYDPAKKPAATKLALASKSDSPTARKGETATDAKSSKAEATAKEKAAEASADAKAAKDKTGKDSTGKDSKGAKPTKGEQLADAKDAKDKTEKAGATAKAKDGKPKDAKDVKGKDAKAKDTKAADAKTAKSKTPERHWVQVAGGANKATLPRAWAQLKEKYPKELAGKSPWTTPLRFTNRLLVGPFKTPSEAQAFVNKTAREGWTTFTFTSPAGQDVEKIGS